MELILVVAGVSIMCVAFIMGLIFICKLLGHLHMILGFQEFKETEATLVTFVVRYTRPSSSPMIESYYPVLKFYNEYLGKEVEKELFNCSIYSEQERLIGKEKQRIAKVR